MIGAERIVDLRSRGVTVEVRGPGGRAQRPVVQRRHGPSDGGGRVWVAVKYHQVPGPPGARAARRLRLRRRRLRVLALEDGYEVRPARPVPAVASGPAAPRWTVLVGPGRAPRLPRREPDDPWVVLAAVDVDGDGTITAIDNCSCRRIMVMLAHLWWRCQASQPTVTNVTAQVDGQTVEEVPRGQALNIHVDVEGTNIDHDAIADLGQGIQVTDPVVPQDGTAMDLTVTVLPGLHAARTPGPHRPPTRTARSQRHPLP